MEKKAIGSSAHLDGKLFVKTEKFSYAITIVISYYNTSIISDEGTITERHVFSLYSDRGILFSIYTLDDIIIQFHCIVFE